MIKRYSEKEIDSLVEILKNDGVICVPTDTVFGICGSIMSKKAYERLREVKGRPLGKAFPVMCANIEQIKQVANFTFRDEKIIRKFMPGPLTIILKKREDLPNYITTNNDTIALRLATSPLLEKIIERVGFPLFMTSANKSGDSPCLKIEEIDSKDLSIDGVLDGKVSYAKPSTILDLTKDELSILREGPISLEMIENYIGTRKN